MTVRPGAHGPLLMARAPGRLRLVAVTGNARSNAAKPEGLSHAERLTVDCVK
jgi:hypothetical protein